MKIAGERLRGLWRDMVLPRKLRTLSLCSGIGGAELGLAEYCETIAYCERDRFAAAVLLSRMADGLLPEAFIWDDVKTLDGKQFRGFVECIVAGFPCQDLSVAGSGAGLDGERSGVWFDVLRLVFEVRPGFVILENVAGIRKHASRVVGGLAALGYDSRWGHVSAQQSGAPHRRERWWLIAANPDCLGVREQPERDKQQPSISGDLEPVSSGAEGSAANANVRGREAKRFKKKEPGNADGFGLPHWRRVAAPEPSIRRMDDGLSRGLDKATLGYSDASYEAARLRCLGNAWCVDQARLAIGELIKI